MAASNQYHLGGRELLWGTCSRLFQIGTVRSRRYSWLTSAAGDDDAGPDIGRGWTFTPLPGRAARMGAAGGRTRGTAGRQRQGGRRDDPDRPARGDAGRLAGA